MRKFLAAVLVALVLPFSFSSPAEATRPMPWYAYPDVCKNIKGHQPIWTVVGATARFQFDTSTKRRYDCVRVTITKG